MNKDAEAEIERLASTLSFTITPQVTSDGAVLSFSQDNVAELVRTAMAWAYQDAARVCREEVVSEPTDNEGDEGYNMAIKHCAAAIEARAKEGI